MATMISRGKELIRIDPKNNQRLQYSTSDGKTWNLRCNKTFEFQDLTDNGKEILATTSKGLYYSTNEGKTWNIR